ncbi:cohesin domain-containing protein [Paenibacillus hexagrammi]|uniref:Cohesin domain-containing protein n=2 Tax=Paenibacillus hexagrammi TaxID=2908839 RepID=A0ABY3SS40_9BACL|nr:cohesin domain-containing protein [Paenibacillus sp. YPD9-1]
MTWSEDGWPVFSDVNDTGIPAELSKSWVSSDDFDQRSEKVAAYHTEVASGENDDNGSHLGLVWQWNHNPDNRYWSLTDRPGYLRLTTGRTSTDILDARNSLTQRTFGPESSGTVSVDVSHMKDGDYAGIAAFQKNYGFVGVKMSGDTKSVVMVNGSSGTAVELASIPVTQNTIYLRTELDFKNRTDKAYFLYSLDGEHWASIGNALQMSYTLPHFMGYRFALFNFATKTTGGYVDFDYFKLDDKLSGANFDTNLKSLQVNGSQVSGFNPSIYSYSIDVPAGSAIPQVTAAASDSDASVTIAQATSLPGKATVTVSRDGLQTTVYTINFDTPAMVAIEAEKAAENTADAYVSGTANGHTWTLVDGQSSKAMQFLPDDGTSVTPGTDAASLAAGSKLGYKINFPTSGTYNVWILAKSHSYQTDSIHVGIDNQYKFTSNGIQAISNSDFRWMNLSNGGSAVTGGTTLNISAGMHELNFWGRESGLIIDRIYVTTSNSAADPVWPTNTTGVALEGPAQAAKGSAFDLKYGLHGMNQNIYGQDVTFTYDPTQVEFVSAESVNPDEVVIVDKAQKQGEVRLLAATIGPNARLDGNLIQLHWKAKSDTTANASTISLSKGTIADEAGHEKELGSKSYTVQLTGAVVDKAALLALIADAQSKHDAAIEGSGAGQYPAGSKSALQVAIDQAKAVAGSTEATQEQVEQAVSALTAALQTFEDSVITIQPGDTNGDGHYSIGDLGIVAAAYGKTSADPNWSSYQNADLNGDGKVDIEDLAAMARKILE